MLSKISLFYEGILIIALFFAVSMASHLLGDMFTSRHRTFCLLRAKVRMPYTIKTDGKIENLIFVGALFAIFNLAKN